MSHPRLPWEAENSALPPVSDGCDELSSPPAPHEAVATIGDVQAMLEQVLGQAANTAGQVAREVLVENQPLTNLHTTSNTGQTLKLADAKSRALRTLFQNLGIDILVALGTVVPMLLSMNFTDKAAWLVFGSSVAKTVVAVFVSYVSRLTTDPVIPTPVETPGGGTYQPPPPR